MNAGTRQGSRALEFMVEPSGKVRVESDKLQSTKYAQEEYAVEGLGLGGLRLSDKDPAAKKAIKRLQRNTLFKSPPIEP